MARTDTLPHFLSDVADAIRTKKGSEDTIQASDFDTEIENLPGGGSVTPTTISEYNSALNEVKANYSNYITNLPNTYTTRTTDAITLYTPEASFNYYVIHKRSSGNYRVVWIKDIAIMWSNNDKILSYTSFILGDMNRSSFSAFKERDFTYTNANSNGDFYISPEYSTLQECVEKFLNNELTYSYFGSTFLSAIADTTYIVPYTNCVIFSSNTSSTNMSQRLSSNETIQVMQ